MKLEDQYKCLVEAYYGVSLLDEYDLKEYILKDIEDMITSFKNEYKNINYDEISGYVISNVSDRTKLQSSLLILNKMNVPIDLILLIKKKLKSDFEN